MQRNAECRMSIVSILMLMQFSSKFLYCVIHLFTYISCAYEPAHPPNGLYVLPITEERANRCLARIDLLNKIREQILWHPWLDARLALCQPSSYLPQWWLCGKHDKDLLIGAAK